MGVLPLQFADGENAESLGLTGEEEFSITGHRGRRGQGGHACKAGDTEFTARVRIDTPKEVDYFQHGGILPFVLRQLLARVTLPGRMPLPDVPRASCSPRRARPATSRRRRPSSARRPPRFAEVDATTPSARRSRACPAPATGRCVAVVGHIDEIGLIVHHIDDDGYLWFTGVGGWDPIDPRRPARGDRHARRRRSRAWSARSRSTCSKDDERKKVPELQATCTSTSARRDGDEARVAGAHRRRRGDRRRAGRAARTGALVSRSMDNRLGCYVALEAARLVAEAGGAPGDVVARGGRAGGDHLRRRAHDRVLAASPTSRSSST